MVLLVSTGHETAAWTLTKFGEHVRGGLYWYVGRRQEWTVFPEMTLSLKPEYDKQRGVG